MNRKINFRQPLFMADGTFLRFHDWGFDDEGTFTSPSGNKNAKEREVSSQQFIGMLDKLGGKIFEGDIVKCDNCDYPAEVVYVPELAMWCLETHNINTRNNPMQSCSFDEATIIGNIYQNPELIIRREAEPLIINSTYCECNKQTVACHDCVCHIEQFYKDED